MRSDRITIEDDKQNYTRETVNKIAEALKACFVEVPEGQVATTSRLLGMTIRDFNPEITKQEVATYAWGKAIRKAFPSTNNDVAVKLRGKSYNVWRNIQPKYPPRYVKYFDLKVYD